MNIQCLIFDLDGVICDTAKYHFLAWKEIAAGLGIELTPERNEALKGVGRRESLQKILDIGGIRLTADEFDRLCYNKNQQYLRYIHAMTPRDLLPGVQAFLQEARQLGLATALGSASKNAGTILSQLGISSLFDNVQDGNTAPRSKPDPQVFTQAADALRIPYTRCVVFEDSMAGIQAAKSAGMRTIGIGQSLAEADKYISGFIGKHPETLLSGL